MALTSDEPNEQRLAALLDKYASEYGSLRITLKCLIDTEQLAAAAHLADSLSVYWETQNYLDEGIYWLNRIFEQQAIEQVSPLLRGKLQVSAGHLMRLCNHYEQAGTQFAQILPFASNADYRLSTSALSGLGEVALRQGNLDKAVEYYQQYLYVSEQENDQANIANTMVALGRIAGASSNFHDAGELYEHGASMCQQAGYQQGHARALNNMGELERAHSNYDKAATLFAASWSINRRLRRQGASRIAQQNLAFTLLAQGHTLKAEQIFAQLLPMWQRGPTKYGMALCLIGLARAAQIRRQFVASAKVLGVADKLLTQIGVRLELTDRREHEITESCLRKALGQEQYLAAHKAGAESSLDEIHAIAGLNPPRTSKLTSRETEVLELVAEGQTNKQIAERLTISPYTVNVHLRTIYRKLGANSRTAAVHVARVQSLLSHNT